MQTILMLVHAIADLSVDGWEDSSRNDALADLADAGVDLAAVAHALDEPAATIVTALARRIIDDVVFLARVT